MLSQPKKSAILETQSSQLSSDHCQFNSSAFASPHQPQGILTPPQFANSFQLDIISALRGNAHDFLARAAVADAIRAVHRDEDKMELIDFLASKEHGTIALTLENNACKMFNCSPSELPLVSSNDPIKRHFLSKLCELFTSSFFQIIPTLFAMLYPLQHFDPNFQIRKIILRHFRDRVLIRTMANFEFGRELFEEDAEMENTFRQMFGLINTEFCDEIGGNESFDQIYTNFMGKKDIGKEQENREKKSNERMKMGRKVGIAAIGENNEWWQKDEQKKPMALSIADGQFELIESTERVTKKRATDNGRKERARTMPSKSVSFWDDHF